MCKQLKGNFAVNESPTEPSGCEDGKKILHCSFIPSFVPCLGWIPRSGMCYYLDRTLSDYPGNQEACSSVGGIPVHISDKYDT